MSAICLKSTATKTRFTRFAWLSVGLGVSVIIAIAGMEGALASVIGGLVDCPVIAVPTSVGYGASLGGIAALLVGLIGYILYRGLPNLSWQLVSTQTSYIRDTIGILPNLVNTVYIILVAMAIALPLGLGAGILAGGLTLVMMILPTIVRTTQESLKTVPQAYREGALALGAGKWRMIRTVVLPSAVDGIVTGCILAIGRITGESAALLFTAGFGLKRNNFVKALHSSSATLTVALYVYASEQGKIDVAFAIALILLALTLVINLGANYAGKKLRRN